MTSSSDRNIHTWLFRKWLGRARQRAIANDPGYAAIEARRNRTPHGSTLFPRTMT